jgi:hypothetical protein
MKTILSLAVAFAMTGCAAPAMYQWGGYDDLLYQSYKNPEKADAMRQSLETHVAKLELARQRVAPGLYAEIGTLYLQSGDRVKAVLFYAKERDTWPESKGLMDAMIKNIDRPKTAATEGKT